MMISMLLALATTFTAHAERGEADNDFNANLFQEANVFNHDTRREVTQKTAPWTAIGKLLSPGGKTYCTATLVARDLILTAAHCIMENGELVTGDYSFVPEYKRGGSKKAGVLHYWWGTKTPDTHRAQDWAILRLDTPMGDTQGWMGVTSMTANELLKNRNYFLGAYSSDKEAGEIATWETGFQFKAVQDGFVLHSGDTATGASGGSVFTYDNPTNPMTNHVVAINVAEFRNSGTRSLSGIPFDLQHANIAVPSSEFYSTFISAKTGQ